MSCICSQQLVELVWLFPWDWYIAIIQWQILGRDQTCGGNCRCSSFLDSFLSFLQLDWSMDGFGATLDMMGCWRVISSLTCLGFAVIQLLIWYTTLYGSYLWAIPLQCHSITMLLEQQLGIVTTALFIQGTIRLNFQSNYSFKMNIKIFPGV